MFQSIFYQLLGVGIYRGGFFVTILYSATVMANKDFALLGMILTLASSLVATFGFAIGIDIKNTILSNNQNIIKIIIPLLIVIGFLSFFSSIAFFFFAKEYPSGQIVFFVSLLLMSMIGVSVFQHIIFAENFFKINCYVTLAIGLLWLYMFYRYEPETYKEFVCIYSLINFFQLFILLLLIIKSNLKKKHLTDFSYSKKNLKFIFQYVVFACSGMPIYLIVQVMLTNMGNFELLASIILLTQITNLLGMVSQQIMLILYNEIAVIVNTYQDKKILGLSFRYLIANILVAIVISILIYNFKVLISKKTGLNVFYLIFNIFGFAFTSTQWIYNEYFTVSNKTHVNIILSFITGGIFLSSVYTVFVFFNNSFLLYYILILILSKVPSLIISINLNMKKRVIPSKK